MAILKGETELYSTPAADSGDTDPITGLLTESAFSRQCDRYISEIEDGHSYGLIYRYRLLPDPLYTHGGGERA